MRRLYGALGALLLIAGLMLWHIQAVERETGLLIGTLQQAEQAVEQGDEGKALRLTNQAHTQWQRSEGWFGVVLRMGDTEEVSDGFQKLLDCLREEQWTDYRSASHALMRRISRLAEMERLRWSNIL
jgi:thioredoxin-like negative regulator of GroEL